MQEIIKVRGLEKTYRLPKAKNGQKFFPALKSVSFTVFQGEIFGILGPNGAGKTTTLEIIEGLKPQTSGTVNVLGFDNLKQITEIKKKIGIQLQSSQYLHHLDLGELLDLFASFYPPSPLPLSLPVRLWRKGEGGWRPKEGDRKKIELLKLVGLEDKLHAEFKDLSGGQKQRFTIATSLANEPEILFLDEPTTGLDPQARRQMWQLIKTINARGITIILTTHYMEEAEYLCHRVAIMDEGKILEIDEPKKLIDRLSDTTQVSFFTESQVDQKIFHDLPEVKKVHASYPKVILEISSLDKISAIIEALKRHNIIFYGFTLKTASLEDVYLKLTGKEYEEE